MKNCHKVRETIQRVHLFDYVPSIYFLPKHKSNPKYVSLLPYIEATEGRNNVVNAPLKYHCHDGLCAVPVRVGEKQIISHYC